jgi:hypothetical protein
MKTKKPLAIDPQGRKIYMAPQSKVSRYGLFMPYVLRTLHHPEAFVTDLSSVYDFDPSPKVIKTLRTMSKYRVDEDTKLWVIAKALQEQATKWMTRMPGWLATRSFEASGTIGKNTKVSIRVETLPK